MEDGSRRRLEAPARCCEKETTSNSTRQTEAGRTLDHVLECSHVVLSLVSRLRSVGGLRERLCIVCCFPFAFGTSIGVNRDDVAVPRGKASPSTKTKAGSSLHALAAFRARALSQLLDSTDGQSKAQQVWERRWRERRAGEQGNAGRDGGIAADAGVCRWMNNEGASIYRGKTTTRTATTITVTTFFVARCLDVPTNGPSALAADDAIHVQGRTGLHTSFRVRMVAVVFIRSNNAPQKRLAFSLSSLATPLPPPLLAPTSSPSPSPLLTDTA